MLRVLPTLEVEGYEPSPLHAQTRDWVETNCYTDVWIELLHAQGLNPAMMLGFTVAQDFEGDHFTFFKPPLEDLYDLFGLQVSELAIYDSVEMHILRQVSQGHFTLVEVDSFYLPDTRGLSYGLEHTKSTIAINGIDVANKRLEYFHGAGFFALEGADYEGLFAAPVLFPYAEFVKTCKVVPCYAVDVFKKHLKRRPQRNLIRAFQSCLEAQIEAIAERPPEYFHRYAFNTVRQVGANFELLASHLIWLEGQGETGLSAAIEAVKLISSQAKILQFQLARAIMKRQFNGLGQKLDIMIQAYDKVTKVLRERYG